MLGQMMETPLTLDLFTRRAATLFCDRPVVTRREDGSIEHATWGDVAQNARRLAAGLAGLGIRPGDRIGTLGWNHRRHLEAYFGIPLAGAVLHTLNLRLHPTELEYIITHAGDRAILVDESLLPLLDRVHPALRDVQLIVVRERTDRPLPSGALDYDELVTAAPASWDPPPLDERQAAAICYTTGTTGAPKGVVYSHRSTVLHTLGMALPDVGCLRERDICMPVVPMFHVNAWGFPFAASMVGAGLVLPGRHLDAVHLLDLFERESVTVAAGVPTIWLNVLAALDKEPRRWNLSRLERLLVGGAAVPPAVIRGFSHHGIPVIHAWGMTETSPVAIMSRLAPGMETLPADEQLRIQCTQGRPLPLVEIRARSSDGLAEWGDGRMGELEVRGPWIAGAYFNNPDGAAAFTDDGWLRTGDIATIDERGYVLIQDRSKDLVKSGGEWISSIALENAIMGHPAVAEAAVIAIPDERWGERPLAVVVFKPEALTTPDELRAFLAPQVASWWVPERFAVTTAIPRTSTGKFKKSELRQAWADGALHLMTH